MTVTAMVLGAGAGAGLALATLGALGVGPRAGSHTAHGRTTRWRRVGPGVAVGVAAMATTGWPVLAILAGAAASWLPDALSGRRRRRRTERSEAVARWIEMLRDTISGATGLEEAIVVTAQRRQPVIGDAVARLGARLQHQPLPVALRGFAADVDDPAADLLVAALVTAAANEARDLARLLGALAEAARAHAQMRAAIDAGREQVRSSARIVLAVTTVFVVALVLFSRDYLAPYGTVEGQLWLALVGAVCAGSLTLLVRLDGAAVPESAVFDVQELER